MWTTSTFSITNRNNTSVTKVKIRLVPASVTRFLYNLQHNLVYDTKTLWTSTVDTTQRHGNLQYDLRCSSFLRKIAMMCTMAIYDTKQSFGPAVICVVN